jgi:hypothetical protein
MGQWRETFSRHMGSTNGKESRPTPSNKLTCANGATCCAATLTGRIVRNGRLPVLSLRNEISRRHGVVNQAPRSVVTGPCFLQIVRHTQSFCVDLISGAIVASFSCHVSKRAKNLVRLDDYEPGSHSQIDACPNHDELAWPKEQALSIKFSL